MEQDTSRESIAEQHFAEEAPTRLMTLDPFGQRSYVDPMVNALRRDLVVLARNLDLAHADQVLHEIATRLGLLDRLKMQATYADFYGHRRRIGKYFMSVNERGPYQVVAPHSEGDSFAKIQLAAFYCLENSTDGATTILMRLNDSSLVWPSLREKLTKIARGSRPLTPAEWARASVLYRLKSEATVSDDDHILKLRDSELPGILLADVLAVPQRSHSELLGEAVYTYWDTVASFDHAAWKSFVAFLGRSGLLQTSAHTPALQDLDKEAFRRIWSSDVDHNPLFECCITRKLAPGELVVLNNMTWAHATTGWSPDSGVRTVAAAFA